MIVKFTAPARAQFLAAIAFIRTDRPAAAEEFKTRTQKALVRLTEFPASGRLIPEFPHLGFRELLVGSYRFFYRVKGDTVWVVGVWHDSQLPTEPSGSGSG